MSIKSTLRGHLGLLRPSEEISRTAQELLEQYKEGIQMSKETEQNDILDALRYTIQDSGQRREFDTGAVRDMQEGKGRCDLLPACAILRLAKHYESGAQKYEDRNWEQGIPISVMIDSAMRHLLKYMDGQTDEDHLVAAAWNIMGTMWMEEKKPEMQDLPSRRKHSL